MEQKIMKEPFQLLHIANVDTLGGVEQLLYHVITGDTSNTDHHIFATGNKVHKNFLPFLRSKSGSLSYEKYLFGIKIPSCIRAYRKRKIFGKKYHAALLWNRFEKTLPSCPTIYYEHGASWIENGSTNLSSFFDKVEDIITISHAGKRILEAKWNVKKPIIVLPNPLRPDIAIGSPRKKMQSPLVLGCIGRLLPLKGFIIAIEVVKRLHASNFPVKLCIVGTGPEKETLKKAAYGLPITFMEGVQDPSSFYDLIDILLVPSIREPFGLVALEAAARGVPIIASSVDGLPEACAQESVPQTLPLNALLSFGGSIEKMPDLVYDPDKDIVRPPLIIDPDAVIEKIMFLSSDDIYRKKSLEAIISVKERANFEVYREKLLAICTDRGM